MPPTWKQRPADPGAVAQLARAAGLDPLVARMLVARGLTELEEVRRHLAPSAQGLHDPGQFDDMQAAVLRLDRAIRDGETILVHGDYDVDGVTGTALLMRLFELVGAKAVWHIPNRLTDGYSFGAHSVERALETGSTVVISVDNGTSAGETIAQLRAHGIDTIVTDHHEPPAGPLPDAVAIVNPKLTGSSYPWRELCGGAVAFKLAWGLARELGGGQRATPEVKSFLQEAMAYVAIATVCDVVPILDENRILASYGLKALQHSTNPGLRALVRVAGLDGRPISAEDVGFQIGPRINASGRLGSAQRAVELLLAKDERRATELARELDDLNKQRKQLERAVLEEARAQAEARGDEPVLVLAGQGWHQGVVGIVAARITEAFGRPALVIGLDGEEGRGSARSVPGLSVLEIMHGGAQHFLRYGGHTAAAGCEVRADAIEPLRAAMIERAREVLAAAGDTQQTLWIDDTLALGRMTEEVMRHLDRLEPFGEGNEKPMLLSRDVHLARPARSIGQDGTHLLMTVREGAHQLKALAFGMAHRIGELKLGEPFQLVYTPRWNTFRGETKLELLVTDFRREVPQSYGPSAAPAESARGARG